MKLKNLVTTVKEILGIATVTVVAGILIKKIVAFAKAKTYEEYKNEKEEESSSTSEDII